MPLINTFGATAARSYGFGKPNPYYILQTSRPSYYIQNVYNLSDGTFLAFYPYPGANFARFNSGGTFLSNYSFYAESVKVRGTLASATWFNQVFTFDPINPAATINTKANDGTVNYTTSALDASGNIYAVGYINGATTAFYLVKYNSSLVIQWQRRIAPTATSFAGTTVDVNSAGDPIVVAYNIVGTSGRAVLMKFNQTTAAITWQKEFYVSASLDHYGQTTYLDSSDNIYVFGSSYNPSTGYQTAVSKFDTSGTHLGSSLLIPPNSSQNFQIGGNIQQITFDGTNFYFALVWSDSDPYYQHAAIVKMSTALTFLDMRTLKLSSAYSSGMSTYYNPADQSINLIIKAQQVNESASIAKLVKNGNFVSGQTVSNYIIAPSVSNTLTIASSAYTTSTTITVATPTYATTTPVFVDTAQTAGRPTPFTPTFTQYNLLGA
jgi:hypothetical protein